jgi:gamma-glutamyltranspeptidase
VPEQAIATPHADATRAGVRAFAAGGSAVDAALAAAAVLTVAYPHNCALGGDLFALARAPDGRTVSVNASGPAPAAADAAALRRRQPRMPVTGPDTVTVPGLVAGLGRLHALGARLPWADALAAAAELAERGVPVAPSLAEAIAEHDVREDPGMSAVFAPAGVPLREGQLLRQPALGGTLLRLAGAGAEDFYAGEVARRLLAGVASRGVPLAPADLAGFAPAVESPLRARFRDLDVLTSPPNASGVLLLQALVALDAAGLEDPLGAGAGVLAEIFRAGMEDRDRWLGDPRTSPVDVGAFLGAERIGALLERARRGARGDRAAVPVARSERPSGDTAAVVAVDASGCAVSLIQSLFYGFGSGILEPATGVLLHNRGAFFTLDPGHPNELAPGRRPAHTLMPVLVERAGTLRGALGTMGGKVHAEILLEVLLPLLAGRPAQEAVDAPRWIAGGMDIGEPDDRVRFEADGAPAARAALTRARLHVVEEPSGSEWLGHAQAVWIGEDGATTAGSDRRADGAAAVLPAPG